MKSDDTFENQQLAIANDAYEELKADAVSEGWGHAITIRIIERRHKLRKNLLVYYRANHISRKKTKTVTT